MNTKKNKPGIEEKGNFSTKYGNDTLEMIQDPYYIDPELKKELKEKNLIGRFVNIKRMEQFGGRHQKGWRPYKRESQVTDKFAQSPDGYVYRGADLVLAVKDVEEVEMHQKMLRHEAQQATVHKMMKRNKQRLQHDMSKAAGIKVIDKECHD